jgi:hypothetical protein
LAGSGSQIRGGAATVYVVLELELRPSADWAFTVKVCVPGVDVSSGAPEP